MLSTTIIQRCGPHVHTYTRQRTHEDETRTGTRIVKDQNKQLLGPSREVLKREFNLKSRQEKE